MTDMEKYRKLEDSEMLNENFERKPYLRQLNLESARTKFKFQTKMTRFVKMNYSSSEEYTEDMWRCYSCRTKICTQSHLLYCAAYSSLREGTDLDKDEDLCKSDRN